MSTAPSVHHSPEHFQPVGAVLALVLPGLGHWYLGHRTRAAAIFLGVLGLFFTGMLVGGIDVVDRREDPVWFIGQGLTGPIAFGVDALHQSRFKVMDPVMGRVRSARPDEARDPETGGAAMISLNSSGVSVATLKNGQTLSPAYPPKVRSVGRMHDVGTLFGAIAGMMNLICVIDAAFRRRAEPGAREHGGTGGAR